MPNLSTFQSDNVVKMLLIGDSGNGKTGALASLALAGYKLRVMDFDKGIEPIKEAILKAGKPEALANVEYETFDDKFQIVGGNVIPRGVPTSVQEALKMLDYWGPKSKKDSTDLGKPSEWGRDAILVIDSLSHFCNAVMRYVQATNPAGASSGKNPSQPEWGSAQRIVEQALGLLYSEDFNTNVIVTAHVTYIQSKDQLDEDGKPAGAIRGLPNALGQALPPKIPTYFNHMLIVDKMGSGVHVRRQIKTVPDMLVNAKSPLSLSGIPATLPLETGLATYFDTALGKTKTGSAPQTATATTTK